MTGVKSFFDLEARSIAGKLIDFKRYAGNVILIENTASA
jgi:glutathione peroxidase-family protein